MKPRAHSVDRVQTDLSKIPDKCDEIADVMENLIQNCKDGNTDQESAQDKITEIAKKLFKSYNYGSFGDSNSIWGRQYRTGEQPYLGELGDINKFTETAERFGFIYQDGVTHPHIPNNEYAAIFVPDIRRYLPTTHNWNRPNSDAVIVEFDDYVSVLGNATSLDMVKSKFGVDENRVIFGNLVYNSKVAMEEIPSFLKNNDFDYSIMDGSVTGVPEYQHSNSQNEMYAVKQKDKFGSIEYQFHKTTSDSQSACGQNLGDYNILFPDTAEGLSEEPYVDVDMCGHSACFG